MRLVTTTGQQTIILPESQFGKNVIGDMQRLLGGTVTRKGHGAPGLDLHIPEVQGGDAVIVQHHRRSPLGKIPAAIGGRLLGKAVQGPQTQITFVNVNQSPALWTAMQAYKGKAAHDTTMNVRVEVPGVRPAQEHRGRFQQAMSDVHRLAAQELSSLRAAHRDGTIGSDAFLARQQEIWRQEDETVNTMITNGLGHVVVSTAVASQDTPSEKRRLNALASMEAGNPTIIDSTLHDPWYEDSPPSDNVSVFQVNGAPNLPTAAEWLHGAYDPLSARAGNEDADRTVATVFGASSLEQLRSVWESGMQQESPVDTAAFVLRALSMPAGS